MPGAGATTARWITTVRSIRTSRVTPSTETPAHGAPALQPGQTGKADWQGGVHDGPVGNGREGPIGMKKVSDGTSKTLLCGDAHNVLAGSSVGNTMWGAAHYPRSQVSTNVIYNWIDTPPAGSHHSMKPANGFRSISPDGCFFVYCDGHVALLATDVQQQVVMSLGSRNRGESVANYE
ncbi:MAG: DUF1559 domain-containing protein [Pirellulales bacterium]